MSSLRPKVDRNIILQTLWRLLSVVLNVSSLSTRWISSGLPFSLYVFYITPNINFLLFPRIHIIPKFVKNRASFFIREYLAKAFFWISCRQQNCRFLPFFVRSRYAISNFSIFISLVLLTAHPKILLLFFSFF